METVDILSQVIAELRKERDEFEEAYQSQLDGNFRVCKELHIANQEIKRLSLGQENKICLTCLESQWSALQEQLQKINKLEKTLADYMIALEDMSNQLSNYEKLNQSLNDDAVIWKRRAMELHQDYSKAILKTVPEIKEELSKTKAKLLESEADKIEILQAGYARK